MKKLLLSLCISAAIMLCATGCKDKCVVNPELITNNGWILDSICTASGCLDRSVIDAPAPGIVPLLIPLKISFRADFSLFVDFSSLEGVGNYTLTELGVFTMPDFGNIGKLPEKSQWYDLFVVELQKVNRLTIQGNQMKMFVDESGTVLSFTQN